MADRPGYLRWWICALLFLATTLNYVDRQILGILAAPLQKEVGWSEAEYGWIVTAFSAAYAIGLLGVGPIIDRIGTRLGYALSVGWWSVAAALHAAASSVLGFGAARVVLGAGQAGNFPAAVKTVAEWFPRKERALAVGVFNCGSNVGAILTPLLVPWMALHLGWRAAFFFTGIAGLLWVPAWLLVYRPPAAHPWLRPAEARWIASDPQVPQPKVPWRSLLRYRQTWALLIARFLTDPVWWFYLYWVPKYLNTRHGLTLDRIGMPVVVIYLLADAGSLFGGWISSRLIRVGWTINRARKAAILICALLVTPLAFAANTADTWTAVLVIGLAAAGHQGWAANMFAMISDLYPQPAVSSMTGIAGFGGSVGGMLAAGTTGLVLEATGSYVPMFVYAGFSYLLILTILQVMIPCIAPIDVEAAVVAHVEGKA